MEIMRAVQLNNESSWSHAVTLMPDGTIRDSWGAWDSKPQTERETMFHLYINPSCERIWRIEFESASGEKQPPVEIRAMTFQDAIHDWWQNGLGEEALPHDIPVELGGTTGGVITIYIEDDLLLIWDVTKDYDPESISCAELVERRKQERLAKKARGGK